MMTSRTRPLRVLLILPTLPAVVTAAALAAENNADSAAPGSGGDEPQPGACCINGGCLDLTETDCLSVLGTFQGDGTSCSLLTVLETDFVAAFTTPFEDEIFLDDSARPSEAEVKQFFIDSGLDAQMSDGQFISDVATEAPASFNPPFYNPSYGSYNAFNGGQLIFAPATTPLEIDTAALTAAVMNNAADIDIIRCQLLQKLDGEVAVVAAGGKEHFNFTASDFGSGVAFSLRWQGIGYTFDEWHDPDAEYALRISVGSKGRLECPGPGEPCAGDLTNDSDVGVPDLLELLSEWGPCP